MLTGIPLVMGEHPGPQIAKAEASLAKIERARSTACARPTCSSSLSSSRTSSRH